jgi:hypothetical protein
VDHGGGTPGARLREGIQAVAEWEAEHGALSEEERADARTRVAPAVLRKKTRRARVEV